MGGEESGGLGDVPGAKSELAGAEFGLGDRGQRRPGRQGANAAGQFAAVALSEQREHLLDLDDLLRRAAQEPEQRFAERLTENS
jgi:hypothetical protein